MLLPKEAACLYGIDEQLLHSTIEVCIRKTDYNMVKFAERYPSEYASKGIYGYLSSGKSGGWLGFWGGIVWLSYLMTKDRRTRYYGKQLTGYICSVLKEELYHSDLGLLVMPSCVADYRMTGSESALAAVNLAARSLLEKYNAKSGIICSSRSDNLNDLPNYKISNLLNIQVLVQANKYMGDDSFGEVAKKNLELICENNIREDGRTEFRVFVGQCCAERQGRQEQTRAFAWALYGMAVCYATTGDADYLKRFESVYHYLQTNKKDKNDYYEFLGDTPQVGRTDSTSAAIIAAALTEILQHEENYGREMLSGECFGPYFQRELAQLLQLLICHYAAPANSDKEGLLLGAEVFSGEVGRSTSTLCGDYFYLETLVRNLMQVDSFWYVS